MVERKHRHIVDLGLTLLHHASLPLQFWDYAFITTVYLINRLPTASLKFAVPFVVLLLCLIKSLIIIFFELLGVHVFLY